MWDDVNHGRQLNKKKEEDGNGTLLQWGANVLKNVFGGSEEEKNATFKEQVNESHPFHTELNEEEYKGVPTFNSDARSEFYRSDSLDKNTPDFSNLLREMYNEPSGGGLKKDIKSVPKRKSNKRKAVASIKKSKKSSNKSRTLPKSRKLSTKRMSKSSSGASARKKSRK